MSPAGFEPAIPVGDRPQTHALDRSATGIDCVKLLYTYFEGVTRNKTELCSTVHTHTHTHTQFFLTWQES